MNIESFYSARNMKKDRPLSPHLQIYKPQLTSVLSIMHRITGVALSFGTFLMVLWISTLSLGESFYEHYMVFIKSWFGKLILVGFTFALSYHLSNGIRHLFWDFGYGYELNIALISGIVVLVSAISLTAIVWSYILF
tara:strand:+ start:54 stop:464 length:411 start_codon:yes stop_codon:yes gene_type:complete